MVGVRNEVEHGVISCTFDGVFAIVSWLCLSGRFQLQAHGTELDREACGGLPSGRGLDRDRPARRKREAEIGRVSIAVQSSHGGDPLILDVRRRRHAAEPNKSSKEAAKGART